MPWVLLQGIFHVVTAVASTISRLAFLLWKHTPFIDTFCCYSTTWILEEGRQCDDRADVVLWLRVASPARDLGESSITTSCDQCCAGRRVLPGLWRVSEVLCFWGGCAGAGCCGAGQWPLDLAAFVCEAAVVPPAPPSLQTLRSGSKWCARHAASQAALLSCTQQRSVWAGLRQLEKKGAG